MIQRMKERMNPRLKGWDYSNPGAYLVTVVTSNRRHHFGSIVDGALHESRIGTLIRHAWASLPSKFGGLRLGASVIMPNHLHAIVWLAHHGELGSPNLIKVMQTFKSQTTRESHREGLQAGPLWQRSFHDRVIRGDEELQALHDYVVNNPRMWSMDPER